jgi:hypothetical protein
MTDRQAIPNPFNSDVVPDPDTPSRTDVPRIHEGAFRVCQEAYRRVAEDRLSWSVLLYGEAGCGKTHLLSRVRKWLGGELEAKPEAPPALFVAVRMETGPGHVWRHLRRRFAEELLRASGLTNLDAILERYASANGGDLATALENAPVRDLGHDLMRVLEHFAAGHQRRLCRAWLVGDGISESDLRALNLPQPSSPDTEDDLAEYDARRFVLAMTRLCAPAPVVFCFDQIEALGLSQQNSGYGAFARMGASLIDETGNSLVISTILATFLVDLQNKSNPIPESDLQAFYRRQHGSVTPRRLIHEARRLFALWQGKAEAPAPPLNEFLRIEFERLESEAEVLTKASAADDVLSQGLPVAFQILGRFGVENVAFGNHTNMTSFASWLKKLPRPKIVVRDERLPIPQTAKVTQQRLKELTQAGGRLVRADKEALAALDAMRRLMARATSGDLIRDGEPVAPQTVREWLAVNLPKEISKLAADILGEDVPGREEPPDALLELLQKHKVLPLEEAARRSGLPQERIENYARAHPDRVCLFGGVCPVVCLAVAPWTPGEAQGESIGFN